MRKNKFDRKTEKAIMKMLDGAARKHGMSDVRHSANKWCTAQRDKASLAKAQKELQAKLEEVNRKLVS